jgi:hypothetical protein
LVSRSLVFPAKLSVYRARAAGAATKALISPM